MTAPTGPHVSQAFVDWLAEHDAKVRHEHGERIAKAIETQPISRTASVRIYEAARIARDLSPAPEAKPRMDRS